VKLLLDEYKLGTHTQANQAIKDIALQCTHTILPSNKDEMQ